ncbi:hypothetical protein KEM48_013341 [Puccinia striiformis f. sp. tritici PST-130]|nr:hypothetical protein KEM48_013341 [Puccinia striiformis f. sp. tritici PST-130]
MTPLLFFSDSNPPIDHLNSLSQILNDTKLKPINKDRVTAVDQRLRVCRIRKVDPNSNLFRIMKAQIENDSIVEHHQNILSELIMILFPETKQRNCFL